VSGIADFGILWKTVAWFGNQARWRDVGIALWADVRRNLGIYASAVLALLLLLRLQQRYRQRLADAGEQVRSDRLEPLKTTIGAVLMTVIVSLPGPLLLWFVAWRFRSEFLRIQLRTRSCTRCTHSVTKKVPLGRRVVSCGDLWFVTLLEAPHSLDGDPDDDLRSLFAPSDRLLLAKETSCSPAI
jgi:hypothetical protein